MLNKLAFKNAGKSIREYAIYFFTLAFGVCVFYLFNSVYDQQVMMDVTARQSAAIRSIMTILGGVSVFVAVILGFLIVYANNFFIKRRKKELGIYMTLGMRKGRISTVLVLETSLIALLSLAIGLLCGVILSQFMSVFTANLFEADLTQYRFVFSADAACKSLLYFAIIFLIVIVFNVLTVSKFKLIDLIYGDRKNETLKVRSIKLSAALCVLSIIILGAAYYLILTNGIMNVGTMQFNASIGCGIVGTILFFYSMAGLLTMLVRSNKRMYYKGLNMFIVRQLSSKVNTNFVSVSVVCIVLLLTIGIFSVGYSMQDMLSSILQDTVQYDVTFIDRGSDVQQRPSFSKVYELLEDNENVKEYVQVHIYDMDATYGDMHAKMPEKEVNVDAMDQSAIPCIALSEYNASLRLRGAQEVTLADTEYVVLDTYPTVWGECTQDIVHSRRVLTINGTALTPKAVATEGFDNSYWTPIMIIPDQYVEGMTCARAELNVMCMDEAAEKALTEQLYATSYENMSTTERGFTYYTTRTEQYEQSVTMRAMLSFVAIYLGIVFMITCAAILAIQQLTDVSDNKYRYELLYKLGADQKMLRRALFVQVLCYFLLPLLLAIVHSFFGLWSANDALLMYNTNVTGSLAGTAGFVGVLYAAYFGMTYVGAKSCLHL